jgi:pyrrolidone-carboxylate peptidase
VDSTTPHPAPAGPAPLTVEESRLGATIVDGGTPVSTQLLRASGLDRLVAQFGERLDAAASVEDAAAAAREEGQRLWASAVARAQGRADEGGTGAVAEPGRLDRYDDRPLYWARIAMSARLRTVTAPHLTTSHQRFALLHLLDRASRGIDRRLWPEADPSATRVMVTGFDTFRLDDAVRHSNPSGAAALQLDGRVLDTPHGAVVVRAAVLPVNYTDFDQGVVEDTFGPVLQPGADRAHLITTISMTARGRMDVEKWAANARGGSPDNNGNQHFGPVSRSSHWPQPFDSPDWIETTLPYQAMIDAGTAPWPVVLKQGVREWPAGHFPDPAALRALPDPTPGSTAAAGTGGDYLSNESMYRSNRLRQALHAWDVPGGHLHISALEYPEDPTTLTDETFEADRRAVVDQTVALIAAAATAVAARRVRHT